MTSQSLFVIVKGPTTSITIMLSLESELKEPSD